MYEIIMDNATEDQKAWVEEQKAQRAREREELLEEQSQQGFSDPHDSTECFICGGDTSFDSGGDEENDCHCIHNR